MPALPRDFLIEMAHKYELSPEQEAAFVVLYSQRDNNLDQAAEALHISSSTFRSRMSGVYEKFSIGGKGSNKADRLLIFLTTEYQKRGNNLPAVAVSNATALTQAVRQHCCDVIEREHSQIQLLNRRHISVSCLYVDVYLLKNPASETPIISNQLPLDYDAAADRLGLGERKTQEPVSGVEVATEKSRLMILGKPGSGKSTFLKYLAEACRQGNFCSDHIPVLILLSEVDTQNFDLLKLIQTAFDVDLVSVEQAQEILKQGQVLILIDGVDEVPQAFQRPVLNQIRDFSRKYGGNKYILSCRTQTIGYTLPNFDYVEVADFDQSKVAEFAKQWFATFPSSESNSDLSEAFLQKLCSPEQERTARLAVTPVLLSLVCWIYTSCQDLPTKRSGLYKEGVELLLKGWDEKRGVERDSDHPVFNQLTPSKKKDLLSYLTSHKLERSSNFTLFEQDEILKLIAHHLGITFDESEAVLQSIESQHGLLVERAQGYWSFSHLTFQEYFAARAVVELDNPESLQNLVKHVTQPRWREVFLLTVEMLPEERANKLVLLMKQAIDQLLAGDERLQKFLTWVQQKSASVDAPYKPAAVRAFYFSLSSTLLSANRILDQSFNPDSTFITIDTDFNAALRRALVLTFKLSNINLKLSYAQNLDQILIAALDYANIFDLDLAFRTKFGRELALKQAFASIFGLDKALGSTTRIMPALSCKLEKLKYSLDSPQIEIRDVERWWDENGWVWRSQLRTIMIEYCNIGHDWQFNEKQKQILHQYYNANLLLVDCLNSDCYISREVREEIEATLLLPVAAP